MWSIGKTVLVGTTPGRVLILRPPVDHTDSILIPHDGLEEWVVKDGDESVTSSAVLQDDDDFTFAIGASEVWLVKLCLLVTTNTGGFKYGFSVPASATGFMSSLAVGTPSVALSTTITTGLNAGTILATDVIWIDAVIVNSTNAGTVRFQWSKNSAGAGDTTVKTNSVMRYGKVA